MDSQPAIISTKTHVKQVPWNAASSLWQSSYGLPLAHTPLGAYLSPKNRHELVQNLPTEELEQKYYNESVKLSYVRDCYNPSDVIQRTCRPQLSDNVKDVFGLCDPLPEAELKHRKLVPGRSGHSRMAAHNILSNPELLVAAGKGIDKMGAQPEAKRPQQDRHKMGQRAHNVSCKIGANHDWNLEPTGDSASSSQVSQPPTRSSRICGSGRGGAEMQHLPGQMRRARSQGASQECSGVTQPKTLPRPPPCATKEELALAFASLSTRTAPARLDTPALVAAGLQRPAGKSTASQAVASRPLDAVVPQDTPQKTKEAAYMPLASPKSKLLDYLNTLYHLNVRHVSMRGMQRFSLRSPRTQIHEVK